MSFLRTLFLGLLGEVLARATVVVAAVAVLMLWFEWEVRGVAFFLALFAALLVIALSVRSLWRSAESLLGHNGQKGHPPAD